VLSVPLERVLMVIGRHPACPSRDSLARRSWSALVSVARRWRWPTSPFLLHVGQPRAASRPGRLSFSVVVRGLPHSPASPISFLSTSDYRHSGEDGGRTLLVDHVIARPGQGVSRFGGPLVTR